MNRIVEAISRARVQIDALAPEQRDRLEGTCRLESWEHAAYQNEQARAFAIGVLSHDEAMVCYAALGENPSAANGGWACGTDLATKVVVTKVIGELLGAGKAA